MKTKSKMIGAILAGIVSVGVSHAALVGEWNFDSQTLVNSGTAGAVHDGIFVTGSPVFSTDTADGSGYSLQFLSIAEDDNTIGGDVLRIDNSSTVDGSSYADTFDNASSFTYSMWVKSTDGSWFQWDEFGGKGNEGGNDGWAMRAKNFSTGTQVDFYKAGTDTTAQDSSPVVNVADEGWHMLTYTYDSAASNLILYIDGVLEGSTSNATMTAAAGRSLVFGAREDGSRGENILLDNIQFYDDALSAGDVLALYSTPIQFFVNPSVIAVDLIAPAMTVTGSVAGSFTSDTDVEVSVSISDSTHPGAFSVLSATPQTLTEPSPSNTVFEIEFDNSVANLLNGESATGVVTFAWNESGSTTTKEVSVPMTVLSANAPVLVGEWTFDSQTLVNSGTAGAVHDGTFSTGTPEFSTDTPDGTGYSLRITSIGDNYNPGGDVLLINNSKTSEGGYLPTFDGDAFTVSMWMKTEDTAWRRWDEFGGKGHENPNAGWAVRSSNDNKIRLTAYGQGDAISSAEPLDRNWHLLTATYNAAAATMSIYVDGESKAEKTGVAITDASIYALAFGAREDGSRGENILLDEIQYYDKALSDEDVAALYTSPAGLTIDPSEMDFELIGPATTITGSVAVSYFTSGADVDISVSISDPAHPGAFSVLSATPQTLTEPAPSNTVFEFEFDTSIANLLDGETATGVVTFVWNESGSTTTREVTVPMTVLFYEDDWMTLVELGGNANAVNPLDLSTEGSSDWVMLGLGGDAAIRNEKIGADYIGDVTVSGTHGSWYNSAYQSSWTNGSPLISTNNVKGNWESSDSHSFSVGGMAPGSYTVTMYCSKYNAIGEMTATLGADSITRVFDAQGSGGGSQYGVFTMNVNIVSPSDSLDVSYVLTTGSNIGLTAITLSADHVLNPGVGDISIEIVSGGTEVALSWDTPDGATSLYGVKATGNLTIGGSWVNIHTDVPGTGSKVTVTNALSVGPEFYQSYIQD